MNREKYKFDDFTIDRYKFYLELAIKQGFDFVGYDANFKIESKQILWRHDVEFSPFIALQMAEIEYLLGIKTTYFFQLHGEIYNSLEKEISEIVYKIFNLGHDIGLHFDSHYFNIDNEADLEKYLKIDAEYFEKIFNLELKTFSFHNTNKFILSCEQEKYAGLINVYSTYFKKEFNYCADSTGYWRYETLEEVLLNSNVKKLQVLTHDSMWCDEIESPRQRVFRTIDKNAQRQKEWYDKILYNFGAKNIDWNEIYFKE